VLRTLLTTGAAFALLGHMRAWDPSSDPATPFRVLKENFFCESAAGVPVQLDRDVFHPFFQRVADAIHSVRPDWHIFAEREPLTFARHPAPKGLTYPRNYVNAAHWCTHAGRRVGGARRRG